MNSDISILSYRMSILIVQVLKNFLEEHCEGDVRIDTCEVFSDLEAMLFEREWDMVIFQDDGEESKTFASQLKSDEMFTALPIVIISDTMRFEDAVMFCDLVVPINKVQFLAPHIYALLRSYHLYKTSVQNGIAAKEHTIERYLMFDLAKKYISHTTFSCMSRSAEKQELSVYEEDLKLTVVFADVSHFTKMSEILPPQQVIQMLNELFHVVIPIVYAYSGDIDKFIGDAFLAVFFDSRAALAAMQEVQAKVRNISSLVAHDIQLHVGIHHGSVVRGNVGGADRYDHTLIGNTVNIASRLESICPSGELLASRAVLNHAGIFPPSRFMQKVKLRGMGEKIEYATLYRYFETNPSLLAADVFSLDACRKTDEMRSGEKTRELFVTAE